MTDEVEELVRKLDPLATVVSGAIDMNSVDQQEQSVIQDGSPGDTQIEQIFDSSLKKKKKKKTGFIPEALPADAVAENGEAEDDGTMGGVGEVDDIREGSGGPDSIEDSGGGNVPLGVSSGGGGSGAVPAELDSLDLDMDFSKAKKKKGKKIKKKLEELIAEEDPVGDGEDKENESGDIMMDTDRDYTYDELLLRAFNQLRVRNPDMMGEKKKFVMKPPQVVRIGSKKTAFANFSEICRIMHRLPKHLLQFLLAELGTSGSIDGNNQLIIKGRFQQKQIENVLRRYIKEYVTCHTCRSPDTLLQKDARLYFLQCEQCNSRCSVAPIKSGFQAVANKQQRQAIRASKN